MPPVFAGSGLLLASAIWDSSKHMKIGSYISHGEIRWNLLLIMQLIPELYRAHTVTVFQTDAGGKKSDC